MTERHSLVQRFVSIVVDVLSEDVHDSKVVFGFVDASGRQREIPIAPVSTRQLEAYAKPPPRL